MGAELGRVTPDVRMSSLPAPGAWQSTAGIQWKGTIQMTERRFGSSSHSSPRVYKKRIMKPSSLSLLSRLPASHRLRLFASPTSSLLCSTLSSLHLIVCPSLHLHSGLVLDRHSSGPVRSTHFHEPRQSDQARDNAPTLKVGSLKRSVPQSLLGCAVAVDRARY